MDRYNLTSLTKVRFKKLAKKIQKWRNNGTCIVRI